jgi:hypothetical protein
MQFTIYFLSPKNQLFFHSFFLILESDKTEIHKIIINLELNRSPDDNRGNVAEEVAEADAADGIAHPLIAG